MHDMCISATQADPSESVLLQWDRLFNHPTEWIIYHVDGKWNGSFNCRYTVKYHHNNNYYSNIVYDTVIIRLTTDLRLK